MRFVIFIGLVCFCSMSAGAKTAVGNSYFVRGILGHRITAGDYDKLSNCDAIVRREIEAIAKQRSSLSRAINATDKVIRTELFLSGMKICAAASGIVGIEILK